MELNKTIGMFSRRINKPFHTCIQTYIGFALTSQELLKKNFKNARILNNISLF